jgi:hypothetical protein
VFQKQITAHENSPAASLHLHARMLEIMPCWALRSGGLTRNVLADYLTKFIKQDG